MIRELLREDRIIVALRGDGRAAMNALVGRSSCAGLSGSALEGLLSAPESCLLVGGDVAIPHARIAGLAEPEVLLALSRDGLLLGNRRVRVLLVLLTPEQEPGIHLRLLQRLASLLPAIEEELLQARDARAVLGILDANEDRAGAATYVNLSQEQVAFELHTSLDRGLAGCEAARRLALHGPNRLRGAARTPWIARAARDFFGLFAVLLWIAAALCFVPGVDMPQLGIAIIAVIAINGTFAMVQEQRSDRAVEMLQRLIAPASRVLRDGELASVDAATLVPGDVIALSEGDLVPADARLIEASEIEVDNSTLTGEATSAKRYKSDRPVLLSGRFLWIELPNIVFAGTAILRGEGRAVVFATGMSTEVGRIAHATEQIRAQATPLQLQLRATVRTIAILATSLGLFFLLLGWGVGGIGFGPALVFFIGLFVANVPEGLLPTVTLSLAMGVRRMARRNVLVKRLPAVETLGCTTVICSDKTGTLTQNVMMVVELHLDGRTVQATGDGFRPRGALIHEGKELTRQETSRWPALRKLLECGLACNNARLEADAGRYRVVGDPTEGALLALAAKAGLRGTHHRIATHPFESVRKRMSVVVEVDGRATAYVKGAPLELLARCDRTLEGGVARPLTDEDRGRLRADHDALARRGLRLLGLACRDVDLPGENVEDSGTVESRLTFLGLAALSDPVRPEVRPAVAACHTAGIRVLMVTGDYGLTAQSVAREIGLGGAEPAVVTGSEVSDASDEALRRLLAAGETIFARVSPEQKLRIVSLLEEMGEVVAVTGDGVNDAPALKRADIGIAMGVRGSDVAKEAADMVLTDDNFASIVAGIEEGRAVFENIKRFAAYIFTSNPQEMYPYVLSMLLPGVPLAMTVMGVLAVDVGTDLVPAMGLGIEDPEEGLMQRPPRRSGEKLLSLRFVLRNYLVQGTILALGCYATYLYCGWVLGFWSPGQPLTEMPASPAGLRMSDASTPYLQTLAAYFFATVTAQIVNVTCRRSRSASLFSRDFQPQARARMKSYLERNSERRIIGRAARSLARQVERHPAVFNAVSNPLVDLGIAIELMLCLVFFYTPAASLYGFAPVPWHVYLFACNGAVALLAFEEARKALLRRGRRLEWLG